jgi:hypothetical protein
MMQIAPTVKVNVAANNSACVQSCCAIAQRER